MVRRGRRDTVPRLARDAAQKLFGTDLGGSAPTTFAEDQNTHAWSAGGSTLPKYASPERPGAVPLEWRLRDGARLRFWVTSRRVEAAQRIVGDELVPAFKSQ